MYLSGHVLGMALDFTVKGMTSIAVRQWIENNQEKFSCKLRLEDKFRGKPISWVHVDVKQIESNPKIYRFNV